VRFVVVQQLAMASHSTHDGFVHRQIPVAHESARAHFIPAADGTPLHLAEWRPKGRRFGPPVFCVHGLTRNSRDFAELGSAMSALGLHVFAADMRGRGGSGRAVNPTTYTPAVYARDCARILESLSLGPVAWIGTSMGGLIAMALADASGTGSFAGVALNDVGPVLDVRGLTRIAGYVGTAGPMADWATAAAAVKRTNEVAFPGRDDAFWNAFARRCCVETAGGVAFDYDPRIAEAFTAPPAGPAIDWASAFGRLATKPMLIVRGETSDLLAPEGVAAMSAAAPHAAVIEVAGVGHAPLLTEPEAFDALLAWHARL
jgi:pimeloyl-ACP methyl ester carboxylesterase